VSVNSAFSFRGSLHLSRAASVAISIRNLEQFSLGAWWAFPIQEKRGFVVVGTSRETRAFAVVKECGRTWYPQKAKLLILADCGGGNSARARAWKYHMQQQLCNPHRLTVIVCYETFMKYTQTTKTPCGLASRSHLVVAQITLHFDESSACSSSLAKSCETGEHELLHLCVGDVFTLVRRGQAGHEVARDQGQECR
jgi:hypothetical protein